MIDSSTQHRQIWDLIPWVINGSAAAADRDAVARHLRDCAQCREEYAFQQHLQQAVQTEHEPNIDGGALWHQVSARVAQSAPPATHAGRWLSWAVAALIVEAVGIGALSTALWWGPHERAVASVARPYRTLASSPVPLPAARVRAVFIQTLSVGQLQQLLAQSHLQVVAGPSDSGVWSLTITDSRLDASDIARQLRANAAVRFAEAIVTAP